MTHEGTAVCKQLEEYLVAKLAKDHAGVKYKVLRIIRFICENDGSMEFRRLIQRKADVIRKCQSFRGTADPLKGDAPNKAVRDEATTAMQALFASENSATGSHSSLTQSMNSRIQGMGSSDLGYQPSPPPRATNFSSSVGSRPMEGIGNPYFANSSYDSSTGTTSLSSILQSENPGREIISAMSTGVQSVAQSLAKAATPYLPASIQQHIPAPTYTSAPMMDYQTHRRSEWIPPKISVPVDPPQADDSDVRRVVDELCLSNPARLVPSQSALNALVAKCQEVDGVVVAETLMGKLQEPAGQWTHKLKALHGIETLHVSGLDLVTESIKQKPTALFALFSNPQCGTKARQVAALLGLIDPVETTGKSKSPSPGLIDDLIDIGAPKPQDDLFDFGEPQPQQEETSTSLI